MVSDLFSEELKGTAKVRSDAVVAAAIQDAIRRQADLYLRSDLLAGDEAARRYHAIVIQGAINGVRRTTLARDLGISARQYTRYQRNIRRRIAVSLLAELQRQKSATVSSFEVAESPLHLARTLAEEGKVTAALARISAILDNGADNSLVSLALCLQASMRLRYLGDVAGASDALSASQRAFQNISGVSRSRPEIEAQIGLVSVEIAIESGQCEQVREAAAVIVSSIGRESDAAEGAMCWLKARALAFLAYGCFVTGRLNESRSALNDLVAILDTVKPVLIAERVDVSLTAAVTLAELGHLSESARMIADASFMARQNNLNIEVLKLDLMGAMISLECGNVSAAIQRLSKICEDSQSLSCTEVCAQAHAYLARAEMRVAIPSPNRILSNSRQALSVAPHGGSAWIGAKVAESFARLKLQDPSGAELAARAADDAAVMGGNRVCRGSTLRELARVAHTQRRDRDARRTIMGAVEAAYTSGKMQQAAQALELAAVIMQQPSHQAEAMTIRRALALSEPSPFSFAD